jgi:putative transposase
MAKSNPFRHFKTSPGIIRPAVMLYIRFPLPLRNVEELLHERGIEISKRRIQSMRSSKWKWHLDEVFVKINGETHYLWRAADHEGEVLESYVTKRRDRKAALKFLRKLMRKHGAVEEIVTDRFKS